MIPRVQFDLPLAALALLAGLALGVLFFSGLWSTVSKAVASPNPALVIMFSFAARTSVALGAICFVAQGHLERVAACMIGFVIAKQLVVRRAAPGRITRAYQSR